MKENLPKNFSLKGLSHDYLLFLLLKWGTTELFTEQGLKLCIGGLFLGLSQFLILYQQPQKMTLNLKSGRNSLENSHLALYLKLVKHSVRIN